MISIVIPARNEEKLIADTIRQFTRLSMPHEVIVSDDGSSDRTVEIAREVADTVITFEGDRHAIGRARNAGVKVAHGDVFVFVDSDSFFPDPDAFFRHALKRLEEDPSLLGIACPQRVRPEIERFTDKFVYGLDNIITRTYNNILHHGTGSGKCIIVRKETFERIGGFREDLIFREDCNLLKRISKIGKTRYDPALIAYHSGRRIHRIGVIRFYYSWILNGLYVVFLDRARDKEWTPIR